MILALDLGQSVGWCAGAPGAPPRFGTLKLAPPVGMDFGRTLASAADGVADLITRHRPDSIAVEAPAPLAAFMGNPGMLATRSQDVALQFALAGLAQLVAYRRELPCQLANVRSVRAPFLRGIPVETPDGRTIKPKDRVNLACVRRGWNPGDDHQADAIAVWAWACEQQRARAA